MVAAMAAPAMPATGLVIDLEYVAALFAREMDRHFGGQGSGGQGFSDAQAEAGPAHNDTTRV